MCGGSPYRVFPGDQKGWQAWLGIRIGSWLFSEPKSARVPHIHCSISNGQGGAAAFR